jgi:transposase
MPRQLKKKSSAPRRSRPVAPVVTATSTKPCPYAAFFGIDWADQQHEVAELDGETVHHRTLLHTPEAIEAWANELHTRFGGRPVAVCLEQAQGGLLAALQQYSHLVLFPINPAKADAYRESFAHSGAKSDLKDAELLARYVREHHPRLRAWRPDTEQTRKLARFVELRRNLVEERKQTMQRIVALLKQYFPLALVIAKDYSEKLMLALLAKWATLGEWQRANPRTLKLVAGEFLKHEETRDELVKQIRAASPLTTDPAILKPNALYLQTQIAKLPGLNAAIETFEQEIAQLFNTHPDAPIFRSLYGAGDALAPRLLVAFGTDRERFESAHDVQCYSGIAPVTKQSGKSREVHRRFACNKFLRQSFHEFADHARKHCEWARAFYQHKRAHGTRHHAAVRALAFKWIRIIFRCWKNHTTYDDERYTRQLQRKQVNYLQPLQTA